MKSLIVLSQEVAERAFSTITYLNAKLMMVEPNYNQSGFAQALDDCNIEPKNMRSRKLRAMSAGVS